MFASATTAANVKRADAELKSPSSNIDRLVRTVSIKPAPNEHRPKKPYVALMSDRDDFKSTYYCEHRQFLQLKNDKCSMDVKSLQRFVVKKAGHYDMPVFTSAYQLRD